MEHIDLVPLWAAILGFAVLMYILLDGFDLGVGMLLLFRRDERERDRMIASVAPVWDFNETWLVFGATGLLAAFPGAFSVALPALYFPVAVMLLGLMFRGVAFEFRDIPGARKAVWNVAFAGGSLIATFAQGVVLGMFVVGFPQTNGQFTGSSWDWIRPFPLFTGFGLVAGYALQGATWLVMKTEGELEQWARRISRAAMFVVFACVLAVSIWTPLMSPRIATRWFSWPNIAFFAPVPILSVLLAVLLVRGTRRGHVATPFVCSVGLFFLSFTGLVISLWPFVAPPSMSLRLAASAPVAQEFLMIGTAFILPVLIVYVVWSYWVFRGKVRQDIGYHM